MREKLLDLMKNEGLKPSQLAELLEINPAGISHILAGRNKPGFDLLQKILRRFPRINPDGCCSIPTRCIATANPNNPHRPLRSNRRSPTDCSVRPGRRRSTRRIRSRLRQRPKIRRRRQRLHFPAHGQTSPSGES